MAMLVAGLGFLAAIVIAAIARFPVPMAKVLQFIEYVYLLRFQIAFALLLRLAEARGPWAWRSVSWSSESESVADTPCGKKTLSNGKVLMRSRAAVTDAGPTKWFIGRVFL